MPVKIWRYRTIHAVLDGTKRTACGLDLLELLTESDTRIACQECLAMLTATRNWTQDGKLLQRALYGNSNGYAVAIVAMVLPGVDWAAYLGGCEFTSREEDAVRWAASHGIRLSREDAIHFFPSLPARLHRL